MYTPAFACKHCGEEKPAKMHGESQGLVIPCDCEASRKAWEDDHRAAMERRKRAGRGS